MKKNVIAFACALAMGFGLVACGGGASDAPASTDDAAQQTAEVEQSEAEDKYGYATASFENWTIELGEPSVVWSADDESDLLVFDMRATNDSDETRKLANVQNFLLFPKDGDDYMNFAYGREQLDVSAEDEDTEPGDSIEMTWAYKLQGTYGDFYLKLQSYVTSDDETELPITGIEPTADYTAFAEAAEAELAAKQDANEAQIDGATISKPEGWYFDDAKSSSVKVKTDDDSAYVTVSFATTSETPAERAEKHAGYVNLDASAIQTATINGVEWAYFSPNDAQFQAFAQADGGVVNASGMFTTWEDAAAVIEAITIV